MFERKVTKNRGIHKAGNKSGVPATKSRRGVRDIVIGIAAVLSLIATFMTLAGYGFMLAMEQFGIAHAFLFGNTLDLIDTSSWVVIFLFENIDKFSFWHEYLQLVPRLAPGIAIGFVLFVLGLTYRKYKESVDIKAAKFATWATWVRPVPGDNLIGSICKTGFYSVIVLLVFPALCVASIVLMIVSAGSLLTAPYIGLAAGNAYVSKYVIAPKHCKPVRNKALREPAGFSERTRKPEVYADCVQVKTERGLDARGRMVLATTTSLLLFDPLTGAVLRIPTRDAIVQTIDKLDPDSPSLSFNGTSHVTNDSKVSAIAVADK